jgi:hypothetical protein
VNEALDILGASQNSVSVAGVGLVLDALAVWYLVYLCQLFFRRPRVRPKQGLLPVPSSAPAHNSWWTANSETMQVPGKSACGKFRQRCCFRMRRDAEALRRNGMRVASPVENGGYQTIYV